MVSPSILKIASILLIISGIILIVFPLSIKFGIIKGQYEFYQSGLGLLFLIVGIQTRRKLREKQ